MSRLTFALLAVQVLAYPCSSSMAATSPPLIAETAHLAIGKVPGQYSGLIVVSSGKQGCRQLIFEPDLTKTKGSIGNVAIDKKAPGGIGNVQVNTTVTTRGGGAYAELWVVDVRYRIKGKVCLPAKWWDPVVTVLRLAYAPLSGGSIAMIAGGLVSNTPVRVTGMAGLTVPQYIEVIEVTSDDANPLLFVLTPRGLRYERGIGMVNTQTERQYAYGGNKKA